MAHNDLGAGAAPVNAGLLRLVCIVTWCSSSWVYIDSYVAGGGLGSTKKDISCQVS